jgi:tRNA threonylcarbamoyladenosine biosynthesis protein TsaE
MSASDARPSLLVRTRDEGETRAVGAAFAHALPRGSTISLEGPLGAGKTVFVRGFCEALGVADPVTSPSYTLWKEYRAADGRVVTHLDCFRLASAAELEDLGVEDRRDGEGYVLVEWGDRALGALPEDTVRVRIEPDPEGGEDDRRLVVRLPAEIELAGDLPAAPGTEDAA